MKTQFCHNLVQFSRVIFSNFASRLQRGPDPTSAIRGKINALEMLVAPLISECFGLPWSAIVWMKVDQINENE